MTLVREVAVEPTVTAEYARIPLVFPDMGRLVVLLDHRTSSFALEEVNGGKPFVEVFVPLGTGHPQVLLIEQPRILGIPLPRELTVSGVIGR